VSEWKSGDALAIPIVAFPIKKRINTELFIEGKCKLYIHKRRIKNSWSDLLEREHKQLARVPEHVGIKTNNGSLK